MDCANAQYPPITGELRKAFMASGGIVKLDVGIVEEYMTIAKSELDDLCDAIDAVHAELERENARLRKKVKHQGAQLSEVQDALERRNSELKPRWQKELDRLKAERDSMAAALDAAQGEHDFAPLSHYTLLPKDADGVPWCRGDRVIDPEDPVGKVNTVWIAGDNTLITDDHLFIFSANELRHYHKPTVEDVLREMLNAWGELPSYATYEAIVAEYAAKLRLADEGKEQ